MVKFPAAIPSMILPTNNIRTDCADAKMNHPTAVLMMLR